MIIKKLIKTKEYPNGAPLYWQFEVSGKLQRSIKSFIEHNMELADFGMVRWYYKYWIMCPNWEWMDGKREYFVNAINNCKSDARLYEIAMELRDVGIDPL